ncbi:MAG: DNA repair protein RecN, partial [Dictyoglomaceae bacterium]|nr:DNA repair protein RecN [Dictyoglomaceae bacterium]
IIIDSINFLLGEKQSKDIIRRGKDFAYVEGVFLCNNVKLQEELREFGIDFDEYVIITREININGKNVSRINGRTVTVNFLKQVARFLIDLHGQHEHQSLLNDENYIKILDSFCSKDELNTIKLKYMEYYEKFNNIDKKIDELRKDEQYKLQKLDILSFQIEEIEKANLKIGEEEELIKRRNLLSNAEKIFSSLANAYERLYQKSEGYSAYDEISFSLSQIDNISKFDESYLNLKMDLEDIYYRLEDIIERLRNFKEEIEFNPDELNLIEERLDLINRLKRKYGKSIQEILDYYQRIKEEYENIENSEKIVDELLKEKEEYFHKLTYYANILTSLRKETADKLSKRIEEELKYLGMEKAKFLVLVNEMDKFTSNGKDEIEFLFSANPGESLKKLNKVASGGEISRIMLAIKTVIADIDEIPTLIFDEIDTGISGRTAQAVAEKICLISKTHQILCVTHLPQIAAMADRHFVINKETSDEKTTTTVQLLKENEKVDEIARLVGGAIVTDLTIKHAKEMLEIANRLKQTIKTGGRI